MLGYDLWSMAMESNSSSDIVPLQLATDRAIFGVIPRSMEWLLTTLGVWEQNNANVRAKISVSYIEIHNERVIDLLSISYAEKSSPFTTSSSSSTSSSSPTKHHMVTSLNGQNNAQQY